MGKYKLPNLRGNHLISILAAFVFVPSVFWEKISTAEFGDRLKLLAGTFLMRTFTCRSTFLYGRITQYVRMSVSKTDITILNSNLAGSVD